MIKNSTRFLLASLLAFSLAMVPSRPSHAAVGVLISAAMPDPATQALGALLAVAGGFMTFDYMANNSGVYDGCNANSWGCNQNHDELNLGLVLLGTSAEPSIEFAAMTQDMATNLRLNTDQAAAYNDELKLINLVSNDFLSRIKARIESGGKKSDVLAYTQSLWETEGKPVLSADAYSAVQKYSAYAITQLTEARK